MGIADKITNAAEEAAGKVQQKLGDLTDNPRTQAKGAEKVADANAKQAAEHAKDAVHDTVEDLGNKARRAGDKIRDAVHDAADEVKKATR